MTHDANGNLIDDGTNTYVWDRANRLLSVGSSAYTYDGLGNRVQQTVGGTATKYLQDMQPGLTQVLAATTGANTDRYVHGLRGIHAMQNNAGQWIWPTQDGLGNVRQEVSDGLAVNGVRGYEPFLTPFDEQGSLGMPFGATGEMTDVTGQVYLRNRYLSPALGQFVSLDPFEGFMGEAMSLNGYSYVHNNPINLTDPSGETPFLAPALPVLIPVLGPIGWIIAAVAVGVAIGVGLALAVSEALNNGCCTDTDVKEKQDDSDRETVEDDDLPAPYRGWRPRPIPKKPLPNPWVPPNPGLSPSPFIYPWGSPGQQPQPLPQPKPQPKPKARRGPGHCRTYGLESDTDIGKLAHNQVKIAFRTKFGTSARTEFSIPGAGPNGGNGSADAVLVDEGIRWGSLPTNNYAGIYEIKPNGHFYDPVFFQMTVDQRNRYIANFYKSTIGGTAVAGTIWEPHDEVIGLWPLDPKQKLYITSHYLTLNAEGLIFYYCR